MRNCRGFILLTACLAAGPRVAADEPLPGPRAQIAVSKKQIDLKSLGGVVASYVIDPSAAKPYFWPMNALPAISVTRPWPMVADAKGEAKDHVHQKSAWFCHGDVIPEGIDYKQHIKGVKGVDFWSEHKGHGQIVCTKVGEPKHDVKNNRASVTTHNEWRTAEGQVILEEERTIHFYHLGANRNLIVLEIDLHASKCPITFGDTKEGSVGVRVRESVRVDKGKGALVNAEGKSGEGKGANKDKKGCWGLVSDWCDYSGPVDGDKVAGLAVYADPKNPISTAWHARNYGLLAANPFGRAGSRFPDRAGKTELVKLRKGEHLKLRYGLYLHAGGVQEGKVADTFEAFKSLRGK